MLGNHKPLEALPQSVCVQYFVRNSLSLNLFLISRQTNWRRTEIEVLIRRALGCGPALIAERIADGGSNTGAGGTQRLHEPLVSGVI